MVPDDGDAEDLVDADLDDPVDEDEADAVDDDVAVPVGTAVVHWMIFVI